MTIQTFLRPSAIALSIYAILLSSAAFARARDVPATSPSASPSAKYPTPSELYEKMKKVKGEKDAMSKVAYFELTRPISERPADFAIFGTDHSITLRSLTERFKQAKDDQDIRAVLITIGGDFSMNLAQAQELRDALADVRKSKKVFVYADGYDTSAYTLASAATDICLLPGGEIMIPGVGLETMFYKGAMDKVGVHADYIQIGEFKGAEEPYTRTAPSDELRGELTKLTEAMYEQVVDGISKSRNVSRDAVQKLIDDTILTAQLAKERGFVDHVIDQDGLRDLLKEAVGGEIDLLANYAGPKKEEVDFSNPFALLSTLTKRPAPSTQPAVAVIYAEGVIVDGDGEGSLIGTGGGVGSDKMRRDIRAALRDDSIKAVVLRIDSPGGSALASEVMWQAARRLAAKKPLIISVGSMAASGGYYLASSGEYIFADSIGIVGSIGVVGGKFVMKDLFDKVGLSTEKFSKGNNAGLFSQNEPWSDRQRTMVRSWMQQTYDQFTQRVMTTRTGKIVDIDKVARGRIFLATQAKELGMVDEIGGTNAAIAHAANRAGLKEGQFEIRNYPAPRTIADFFGMGGDDDTNLPQTDALLRRPIVHVTVGSDSVLNLLSPDLRKQLGQQVQFMRLMQQRPIVLMSPFTVTTK